MSKICSPPTLWCCGTRIAGAYPIKIIKSPFFVPSSSSSASKHTTNGQLTEIDSQLKCESAQKLHNISHKYTTHSVEMATSLRGTSALGLLAWGLGSICRANFCRQSGGASHDAPFVNALIDPKTFPREMEPSLWFFHGIDLHNALQASRYGMICQDVQNRYFFSLFPFPHAAAGSNMPDLTCLIDQKTLQLITSIHKQSRCNCSLLVLADYQPWPLAVFEYHRHHPVAEGHQVLQKVSLAASSHAVSSTSSDSESLTFSFTTFSSWKRGVQQSLHGNFVKFHHGTNSPVFQLSKMKRETRTWISLLLRRICETWYSRTLLVFARCIRIVWNMRTNPLSPSVVFSCKKIAKACNRKAFEFWWLFSLAAMGMFGVGLKILKRTSCT